MCVYVYDCLPKQRLKVKVMDFHLNRPGCSKIAQQGLPSMTHVGRAFKGLIPFMPVSDPQKAMLFASCSAPWCCGGFCSQQPLQEDARDVLLDHSWNSVCLNPHCMPVSGGATCLCVCLQRGSQRVTVCSVLCRQGQRG